MVPYQIPERVIDCKQVRVFSQSEGEAMEDHIRDLERQLAEERAHADELFHALLRVTEHNRHRTLWVESIEQSDQALAAHRERRQAGGGQG